MVRKIRFAGRTIGNGEPCFIIAEAGVNHNGKFSLAKKMVDAAKKAGADAVKFQVFCAERVATEAAEKAAYQKRATGKGKQYDMLKRLELTRWEFRKLAAHAKRKKIIFLASPFDGESVDFLGELKVPALKVASGEITNFPLLKHVAEKGKPVILSTGISNLKEVAEALEVMRRAGAKDIVLLHCVSNYPASAEDTNLRAMETMKRKFGLPVGLSDHTLGTAVSIAAVALGACMIEKHFTLNRCLPGPDHKASLEADEFAKMVTRIRDVEKALGDGIKKPTKSEIAIRKFARRSIVAGVNLKKGTVITRGMLEIKRPGTGIEPKYIDEIVGGTAKTNIKSGNILRWSAIKRRRGSGLKK